MSPRKMLRDLKDTPFSQERLIIWTLAILSLFSLVFIFMLTIQDRDIPPSITMAFGITITAFINKFDRGSK